MMKLENYIKTYQIAIASFAAWPFAATSTTTRLVAAAWLVAACAGTGLIAAATAAARARFVATAGATTATAAHIAARRVAATGTAGAAGTVPDAVATGVVYWLVVARIAASTVTRLVARGRRRGDLARAVPGAAAVRRVPEIVVRLLGGCRRLFRLTAAAHLHSFSFVLHFLIFLLRRIDPQFDLASAIDLT